MYILRRLLLAIAAFLVVSGVNAQPASGVAQQGAVFGYLGVGIDNVPDSIRAHFPENVAKTQGLLVTRFADESPAADDGIKVYDVLLAYDDQLLDDPQKFINKVREDKPGRTANLKLIRQGEVLTVPVTIGSQKPAPVAQFPAMQQRPAPIPYPYQYQNRPMPYAAPNAMPNMQGAPVAPTGNMKAPPGADYNGLAIRRIGQDIYDASIGFTAPDGSKQRRSYKGTREQILQQIMMARDLPPSEKQQLIFAVKPRKQQSSGFGNMPFNDGNMFNPGKFFKGWGW